MKARRSPCYRVTKRTVIGGRRADGLLERYDEVMLHVLLVLLFCGSTPAAAHDPLTLRFSHINARQGLSENTVTAITQDRTGFLWFGTQNGLNRYDGFRLQVFSERSPAAPGLAEDFINALLVDSRGLLWIATFSGGLNRYDPGSGAFHAYLDDDPELPVGITSLAEDGDGRVWAGTANEGLMIVDPASDRIFHYSQPTSGWLPSNRITAVHARTAGAMLVGTSDRGVFELTPIADTFETRPLDLSGLDTPNVTALLEASDGTIWIGTATQGIVRFTADGAAIHNRHDPANPDSLASNAIQAIYQDPAQRIWIGTAFGLDRFVDGAFEHHRHQLANRFTLPFNEVLSVFQDRTGTLWVGTGGGGVSRHAASSEGFRIAQHVPGDPATMAHNVVWGIATGAGATWVGTFEGGITAFHEDGRVSQFNHRPDAVSGRDLSNNDVRAIEVGPDGAVWAGTKNGLNRIDPETGSVTQYHSRSTPGLRHDYIRSLLTDTAGNLWVGTYGGGLHRMRDGVVVDHYHHVADQPTSLSDDRIYVLLEDSSGRLWVGTHGGGLNLLEDAGFRHFRHDPDDPKTIPSDRVLALAEGDEGELWVGTSNGLGRLDAATGEVRRIGAAEGLPNEVIYGLLPGPDGKLWMSTNHGIIGFDPVSADFVHYPLNNLLYNTEFNGGSYDRDGDRLYFGGVEGLVSFRPSDLPAEPSDPVPTLTGLELFNEEVRPGTGMLDRPMERLDRLQLNHDQNMITLRFAALDVPDSRRVRFQYRMDGYDNRWLDTGYANPSATYTGLPSGDFRFRLRAAYGSAGWAPQEARLDLTIRPAPWRSPAAYAVYAAVVLLTVTAFTRSRMRRVAEQRAAQEKIRESEERLSLSLWASGDVLWDWDLSRGFLYRSTGKRIGQERAQEQCRRVSDLQQYIHPDDFTDVSKAMNACLAGTTPAYEMAYRARTGRDRWLWVLARGQVVERDAKGAPLRMSGTTKNIEAIKQQELELKRLNRELDAIVAERTEQLRKRSEDLAQRNEQLNATVDELTRTRLQLVETEKMASLGRMVAGIAHEINTPLGVGITAVTAGLQRLDQLRAAAGSSERLDRTIEGLRGLNELAEKNLARAAEIVKVFKQVASTRENEPASAIALNDCVDRIIRSIPDALRNDHRIDNAVDPDLRITTRRQALELVLFNVVENALKHGFDGLDEGTVTISARQDKEQCVLEVADNGVASDPELEHQIFEPFYTTARSKGGMGLGMHIAYNIVSQALKGSIACRVKPTGGLIIRITLPKIASPGGS